MAENNLTLSRGDVISKKYEIVDHVDENPLGRIYRAKHTKTGRFVRLTMLHRTLANPDERDAANGIYNRTKSINHPRLLKVGEFDEWEGQLYFTEEDFEGNSLRKTLQDVQNGGRQLAIREAAQIVLQILKALSAAHDNDFVFRALRPEHMLVNIKYTGPRKTTFVAQVKLSGLGFWDLVPSGTLAEDEFSKGEAQYLAPELMGFEPEPTPRSDIYSAGVIFYEMLTGNAPVGTFQLPGWLRPGISNHINDVAELALAHSPEDRYQTARDFINDLQRVFQEHEVHETQKRPLITPVGWALGFALIAALFAIVQRAPSDPVKSAQAEDHALQKQVYDSHHKPTQEEYNAIRRNNPKNMVYIPGGQYISGRMNYDAYAAKNEQPTTKVVELKPYLVDIFEYPNKPSTAPLNKVGYEKSARLCAEQSKRLCTADEWEKACKGNFNTIYSYGDTFDIEFCGDGLEGVYPSGQKRECKSTWNTYDMSGNFREWTSSAPVGQENRRFVRGGMQGNAARGTRCAHKTDESISWVDASLSFRCCRDVDALPITDEPVRTLKPEPADEPAGEAPTN